MPSVRFVTYEFDVECRDCDWTEEVRVVREEADVGDPSLGDVLPNLKADFRQEHPACPECEAESFRYGSPEVVDSMSPDTVGFGT